ncbi:MAG: permease [Candidatus Dormibacter sp.]|uniref:permease n=1 Tax=Candidatus Dormibacter sp. TaxID=2973982 RepID=UPI0026A97B51
MFLLDALRIAFFMFWEVLWSLALGFLLSAAVQAVISKGAIVRALGQDSPRSVVVSSGFGIASSSCSYAAVAVARSLFRKGATLANAIIFEFASTNLVIELGLILLVLLGWQFLAAEYAGGALMIVLLAFAFRLTLRRRLVEEARAQAEQGRVGKMEGHAAMDMAVTEGPFLRRLFSGPAFTAISHYFVMDVYGIWLDLAGGFLIAGAVAAWIPNSFWSAFFLTGHPLLAEIWGPLIGPVISMLSFVCSIGNVPLAAVLWGSGISFGGVISFIFADLLIPPILNIYRKYYGGRVAVYLAVVSYLAMALAGFLISLAFKALGWVPARRLFNFADAAPTWNYTTVLDLVFLILVGVILIRFLRTGGMAMLRMMDAAPSPGEGEMGSAHSH